MVGSALLDLNKTTLVTHRRYLGNVLADSAMPRRRLVVSFFSVSLSLLCCLLRRIIYYLMGCSKGCK